MIDINWKSRLAGAGVAHDQLVTVRPSELGIPGSTLGDSNVCFDFLLICVALALNSRKMEQFGALTEEGGY